MTQSDQSAFVSREEALWIIGQIQGDTSAIATSVRAKLLAYLTGDDERAIDEDDKR